MVGANVCVSHIYSIFLSWFSVLPLASAILISLVRILFSLLCGCKFPNVYRYICYLCHSELGMPSVRTCQHTLRIAFHDQMCQQSDEEDEVWKEDVHKNFPLREMFTRTRRRLTVYPRGDGSFYRECWIVLKYLYRSIACPTSRCFPVEHYIVLVRGTLKMIWLMNSVLRIRGFTLWKTGWSITSVW